MSLADCDSPTSGFERTDATLVVEDVVFSGSSPTEQVQSDGSTRTLPALSATWTAPTNPYVVGVEFEYVLASGVGETVKTSAQPPQAEAWKTNNSIVGGTEYACWYRAVGVGSDNYGDWEGPTFVTIDMDVGPYQGNGPPTFIAPVGSTYQRQDVSQQYRFIDTATTTTLTITNPGAETAGTTGWTATAGALMVRTNYVTDVFPHTGSYFFAPASNANLTFRQVLSLPSGIEYLIDAGLVTVGNLGCYHNPGVAALGGANDQARFFVAFLDGGGSVISTIYTSWNSITSTWTHLTIPTQTLPSGTRDIAIGCESQPEDAVHDSFFDDFSSPLLTVGAGWRLMSDLTAIEVNGVSVGEGMTGLKFIGPGVSGSDDGLGNTTIVVSSPVVILTASEALTAGQIVSFHNSSGAKVRKADKTNDTKQADGFVLANVAMGDPATVYLPGAVNTSVAGLTPGALYFLSAAGGITDTATTTPGEWLQEIGRAADATHLVFHPKSGIKL